MRTRIAVWALAWALCCVALPAWAVDNFAFDFYYQRIEAVTPMQNGRPVPAVSSEPVKGAPGAASMANPATWWDRIKSFFSRKNPVQKIRDVRTQHMIDDTLRRNPMKSDSLREGADELVGNGGDVKYRLTRRKVQSERQLLELMGAADGDVTKLSEGQRALLDIYRSAQDPQRIALMKTGFRPKVSVILTDTNGHNEDTVVRDFWPYSCGDLVQFNSKRFDDPWAATHARSVFAHECAHSLDKTYPENNAYGPDGMHYQNEVTQPKAAFSEGWAEVNQMLDYPFDAEYIPGTLKKFKVETSKGVYEEREPASMTASELLRVEGVNAQILYRMAKETPDGRNKLYANLAQSNDNGQTIQSFLKAFVTRYPADVNAVLAILDQVTLGRLTDAEMRTIFGNKNKAVDDYLATRRLAIELAAKTAASATAANAGQPVSVVASSSSTNPFD